MKKDFLVAILIDVSLISIMCKVLIEKNYPTIIMLYFSLIITVIIGVAWVFDLFCGKETVS